MSQFSRRAKWLNAIFPASVAPQIQGPGELSEDVSLVQPYDGGGYGLSIPGLTVTNTRSPLLTTAPTGFHIFFTTRDDEIFRFLSADIVQIVDGGPAPSFELFMTTIDGSLNQVLCADPFVQGGSGLNVGEFARIPNQQPIIGPGQQLRVDWVLNVAGTQYTVGISGYLAPLGTVFYV